MTSKDHNATVFAPSIPAMVTRPGTEATRDNTWEGEVQAM